MTAFIVLAVALAVALAAVYLLQGRLIFGVPGPLREAPRGYLPKPSKKQVVMYDRMLGELRLTLGSYPEVSPRKALVWLPGRNEDVRWVAELASWLGTDWVVVGVEYSYLRTSFLGSGRCEESVLHDSLAALMHVQQDLGIPASQIVLAGRSLGGAAACIRAGLMEKLNSPIGGLVLLTPPASVSRLLGRFGRLARPFLTADLDAVASASRLRGPVYCLLAESDARVPHEQSELLIDALRSKGNEVRVQKVLGTTHKTVARHADTLFLISRFANEAVSR